jgi:hypothetical protein
MNAPVLILLIFSSILAVFEAILTELALMTVSSDTSYAVVYNCLPGYLPEEEAFALMLIMSYDIVDNFVLTSSLLSLNSSISSLKCAK